MINVAVVTKKPSCLYWSEVEKWTSTASLLRFGKLPKGWRLMSVHEFANQIENKERVESHAEYQMAGVKWYGEGVFHRETVLGKDLSSEDKSSTLEDATHRTTNGSWRPSLLATVLSHPPVHRLLGRGIFRTCESCL